MGDKWTLEVITPQKNMALFTKKMLNIFKKYDKPFENSVLVNVETMAYDTPNGPKPWRGEITYPVLDADAGSGQSDMSIASPQSGAMDAAACTGQADMSIAAPQTGAMDMKTPTAVNINEQTYVGTNEPDEQDDPEEQEDHATSTSPKTDAHESTVLPASAKNNETIILSSDKCPRNFKLIISPMTDKRVSVALRSMSYLEIDQTYSVNLDCLIEDAFLSKSYELKVTQHDPYKFLQKTKKSCWKDVSCDYRHEKLNKMESLRNNRTFMVMDSPNGIPKGHLSDQSEIHSQTSGCCDSRELLDKPNVEEIAISSFQGAHEELNTSSKATYSLGDVYSGLVKRIARSMLGPISKSSFRTRRNSYKSKYAKSIIIKRKATDSTILKSSVKTASECGTLATTHNKTRVQSLECSTLATTHNKTRAQSLACSTLATLHNKTSPQNLECSTLATTHNKTSALRLECSTLATKHNKTSAQSLECSTLTTTHNKTSAQSLEYSPVSLCKKYFLPTSTLVAKPDEIACSDSFHEKSVVTLGEGSRTSLVSDGSSSTTRAILMPEGLLKNRREMTNPPPLETDHQYEADVCGPHAVSRKTVDDRPQYTNLRCPTIQASACEHSLAAAVTFNADNQAHEVCCSESAGCLCCKHSQHLMQSATHTFVNIPVVSQKTNLPGNENNIQAGLQMAKHTTCKQYCSPSPDGEIQRKKFDISQMSSVYLNIKQNSSLKDEKEESNFDKIYRKLCLESNSPLPVLKKASSSTKTLVSSEKPNELINSPPFYKKVKRNSDFHGDDPIVPNGKKVKSRNVNFNSSEIVNYLYGGVNSPNIEKSPAYLHSNAKWL